MNEDLRRVCFLKISFSPPLSSPQGGFDSGFLYHCTFSARQDEDPDQRTDEPFDFRPVHNADEDPIRSITFR